MTQDSSFTARLRQAMEGATAAQVARTTGISVRTIQSYVQGKTADPGLSHASAIAEALGVSLDWLATGRGPIRRPDLESPIPLLDEGLLQRAIIEQAQENKRNGWRPTPEELAGLILFRYRLSTRGGDA